VSVRRAFYSGISSWNVRSPGQFSPSSMGGNVTTSGGYKIHTFTSTGSSIFNFITGFPTSVDFLIVAGGGGALTNGSFQGGAGAGGYIFTQSTVSIGAYSVVVGEGGLASSPNNTNGGNSSLFGQTAIGGGRAPNENTAGFTGGSGSGGGGQDGSRSGGSGTQNQGNAGGIGGGEAGQPTNGGGGGGGAGAPGGNRPGLGGGVGGNGLSNSISGSSVTYAGGAGGGTFPPGAVTGANTGAHGAGSGTNRGGGGQPLSNNGDAGIVIIRYLL
jgi:hypothetical protein